MKNKKNIVALLAIQILLLVSMGAFAQNTNVTESGNQIKHTPRDNFYDRYLHTEKNVLSYDYIHEKDVMWEKRIWRLIDVDEKKNHIFKNERAYFINILLDAAKKGDVTLYSTYDDEFSMPFSREEACVMGTTIDTICTIDPTTFEDSCFAVVNELNPDNIKEYRLKEVYFFDEERSTMDVRILGIAPLIERYDDNGNFLNSGPMFWVYYPEARETLARQEAFNEHNDAARMTWEDIFEARLFASYIIKESNVYDRRIKDYKTAPMAILLESDKIKESIFNFEHDLWSY